MDERYLLVGQATPSLNGIWIYKGIGNDMKRPDNTTDDFNAGLPPVTNVKVIANEGTTYANSSWRLLTIPSGGDITIDATSGQAKVSGSPQDLTFVREDTTVNVKLFGAVGDGAILTDAHTTYGSSTLTSSSSSFSSSFPSGTSIVVVGANANAGIFVGTASYGGTSTTLTLSATAGSGVSNATAIYGTDDSTPITNAINALSATGGTIVFPPGLYAIANAITIPANIQLQFEEGAIIAPIGVTVTILGKVRAHSQQWIFSGIGTVTVGGTGTGPTPFGAGGMPWGEFDVRVRMGAPIDPSSVSVTSGGSGYLSTPTVTFDAPSPGGLAAQGTAVLSGGSVASVTVTSAGSGYLSPPNFVFSPAPPGGTTAVGSTTTLNTSGLGTVMYQVSFDGGNTYSMMQATTSGLQQYGVSGTGITFLLPNTTFTAGDYYDLSSTPALAFTSLAFDRWSVKNFGAYGDATTVLSGQLTADTMGNLTALTPSFTPDDAGKAVLVSSPTATFFFPPGLTVEFAMGAQLFTFNTCVTFSGPIDADDMWRDSLAA